MPALTYGTGSYRRERGGLPAFTLVNMFLEATPSAENGVVLQSRQGLMWSQVGGTAGTGPVRGIFSKPGTFNGDLFRVSGNMLYRGEETLGAIDGDGHVSWAASASEVLVSAGASLYSYNGSTLQAVSFPDGADVRAVAFLSGHFVAIRRGSQKFYWSAQLDGRSWDALDFASAESEPDALLDIVSMRGNLYLMGQQTIEPWYYTGQLDLPFSLIQQRLFPKGVHSTGCAIELDNALVWIGSDNIVYRSGEVPERISDHSIEERIAASRTVPIFGQPIAAAFGFIHEGHSFFCVRLLTATFAFDFASGQWCEFRTHGRVNFAGRCATNAFGGQAIFGDDATGKSWQFGTAYTDDGAQLLREFTAALPLKGGATTLDSLEIDANAGRTAILSSNGADPMIEVASSRDAGMTFGDFRQARMGAQGEYRARPRWTRLGQFDAPGAMFKVRVTDPVDFRVSNILANEPIGGRSRG